MFLRWKKAVLVTLLMCGLKLLVVLKKAYNLLVDVVV